MQHPFHMPVSISYALPSPLIIERTRIRTYVYGFLIYESFISSVDNNVHMWCLENEFRYGAFQLDGNDFRLNLSPGF